MTKIYRSLTDLIGNTPLLELTNYNRKFAPQATIIAKLEYFNPAGSAKDRIAMAMIDAAEARGLLQKDSVIIEPTSGNTHEDWRSHNPFSLKRLLLHPVYLPDLQCLLPYR